MITLMDVLLGAHAKRFFTAIEDAVKHAQAKDDCCAIPETTCPPRCVESITWKLGRGSLPSASVVVRNEGTSTRTFAFAATPLMGPGPGAAVITVTPASASLAPGMSTHVSLGLAPTAALVSGQEYHAEFTFTGSWQQCVPITARVLPDVFEKRELTQQAVATGLGAGKSHPSVAAPIHWKIQRGMTPEAQIVVRNLGEGTRTFHVTTSPLVGPDAQTATFALSPSTFDLAPKQHAVVSVRLTNTTALQPRQVYSSSLLIDGYYEDHIPLSCTIEPDATEHVRVSQGDPPTRIVAHQWYHHFQCTVPCAPEVHAADP